MFPRVNTGAYTLLQEEREIGKMIRPLDIQVVSKAGKWAEVRACITLPTDPAVFIFSFILLTT
jgi:hypothetical protein